MNRGAASLRLWLATAALALGTGLAQQALAADGAPGQRGPHMQGHGGGMGMGMGMGMMGMRGIERMFDAVQATPEQRSQILARLAAARPQLQQQREAGRALHEQARALWTQPTVDANAAEALRQRMVAQHDQSSRAMLQVMLDVAAVLTPEQRQRLAELRATMRPHGGGRG